MYLRRLVALGLLLDQLSLGVNCEDPAHRNSYLLIGEHILYGDMMFNGSICNPNVNKWLIKVNVFPFMLLRTTQVCIFLL